MNLGKLLKSAARVVKNNPEIALMVVGVVAPSLAVKGAKVVAKAKAVREVLR